MPVKQTVTNLEQLQAHLAPSACLTQWESPRHRLAAQAPAQPQFCRVEAFCTAADARTGVNAIQSAPVYSWGHPQ